MLEQVSDRELVEIEVYAHQKTIRGERAYDYPVRKMNASQRFKEPECSDFAFECAKCHIGKLAEEVIADVEDEYYDDEPNNYVPNHGEPRVRDPETVKADFYWRKTRMFPESAPFGIMGGPTSLIGTSIRDFRKATRDHKSPRFCTYGRQVLPPHEAAEAGYEVLELLEQIECTATFLNKSEDDETVVDKRVGEKKVLHKQAYDLKEEYGRVRVVPWLANILRRRMY